MIDNPHKNHTKQEAFGIIGEVKWIKSRNGKVLYESPWMKNKVLANTSNGIYLMLDRLAGITTYSGVVSHADLGDSTDAVDASTDTGCVNPLVRVAVSSVTRSTNQITFRFFFPDASTPDDTYEEFSMAIDGSATPGDGQGFNRLLMSSPLVKAAGEDYTIVCRITGNV